MTKQQIAKTGGGKPPESAHTNPFLARGGRRWVLLLGVVACLAVTGVLVARPFWRTRQQPQEQGKLGAKTQQPTAAEPSPLDPAAVAAQSAGVGPEVPPEPAAVPPEPDAVPAARPRAPSGPVPPVRPEPETQLSVKGLNREAVQVATRLTEEFPNRAIPLVLAGTVYDKQGNCDEAIKYWAKALRLDPHCVDAYHGMGWVAFRRAEYEKAVALWRRILEIEPRKPGIYNLIGRAMICLGRQKEAIDALTRDLEINPTAFHSHLTLGQTYLELKEYQAAKESYEAALKLHPDSGNACYGLATVCMRLGQKDEADRYREKFKKLRGDNADVADERTPGYDDLLATRQNVALTHTAIARYYRRRGNLHKAEQLWRRAAVLDPENISCRQQLASLYEMSGRDPEALRLYQELRGIEPDNPLVYAYIGALNARMQQFEAAEEAFRKAVQLAPERPGGYRALAQLYLLTNENLAEAKQLAAKAVKLAPTAENYSVLGEACEKNGDRAGALAALKRAMELDPDSEKYRRMYRRIEQRK